MEYKATFQELIDAIPHLSDELGDEVRWWLSGVAESDERGWEGATKPPLPERVIEWGTNDGSLWAEAYDNIADAVAVVRGV